MKTGSGKKARKLTMKFQTVQMKVIWRVWCTAGGPNACWAWARQNVHDRPPQLTRSGVLLNTLRRSAKCASHSNRPAVCGAIFTAFPNRFSPISIGHNNYRYRWRMQYIDVQAASIKRHASNFVIPYFGTLIMCSERCNGKWRWSLLKHVTPMTASSIIHNVRYEFTRFTFAGGRKFDDESLHRDELFLRHPKKSRLSQGHSTNHWPFKLANNEMQKIILTRFFLCYLSRSFPHAVFDFATQKPIRTKAIKQQKKGDGCCHRHRISSVRFRFFCLRFRFQAVGHRLIEMPPSIAHSNRALRECKERREREKHAQKHFSFSHARPNNASEDKRHCFRDFPTVRRIT